MRCKHIGLASKHLSLARVKALREGWSVLRLETSELLILSLLTKHVRLLVLSLKLGRSLAKLRESLLGLRVGLSKHHGLSFWLSAWGIWLEIQKSLLRLEWVLSRSRVDLAEHIRLSLEFWRRLILPKHVLAELWLSYLIRASKHPWWAWILKLKPLRLIEALTWGVESVGLRKAVETLVLFEFHGHWVVVWVFQVFLLADELRVLLRSILNVGNLVIEHQHLVGDHLVVARGADVLAVQLPNSVGVFDFYLGWGNLLVNGAHLLVNLWPVEFYFIFTLLALPLTDHRVRTLALVLRLVEKPAQSRLLPLVIWLVCLTPS